MRESLEQRINQLLQFEIWINTWAQGRFRLACCQDPKTETKTALFCECHMHMTFNNIGVLPIKYLNTNKCCISLLFAFINTHTKESPHFSSLPKICVHKRKKKLFSHLKELISYLLLLFFIYIIERKSPKRKPFLNVNQTNQF